MHYRFIQSINDIEKEQWNAVTGIDYPFLRHEFLQLLEDSGSVNALRGWQPQHLLIEDSQQLLAVLPLYIKSHSYGEYVFDWSWAEAYQRHGMEYYPKLVAAIPFTPATGPRFSCSANDFTQFIPVIEKALLEKAQSIGASGWHVLFPLVKEQNLWRSAGASKRLGCQFHWHNDGYSGFDDFLATLSSRKRKDIKKERLKVLGQDVRLERLTGDQISDGHWQTFYRFYQNTYMKKSGHGGYLTPAFFSGLSAALPEQLLLVLAYKNDIAVAGSLYCFSRNTLYGRYWGGTLDIPGLHFEACYYQGIEFCIERGLQHFDAGAQGEHKIQRGFVPTLTCSYHWIGHPGFRQAIDVFLKEESTGIQQYQQEAMALLPFRPNDLSETGVALTQENRSEND